MYACEFVFERFVLSRRLRMCAQVVPKRQVAPLLLTSGFTQMDMMRARPLSGFVKERVHEVKVIQRDMTVP